MVYKTIRGTLEDHLSMNNIQINLTILAMITIVVQGIGFYFIDKIKLFYDCIDFVFY